jgi:hypothetical protein
MDGLKDVIFMPFSLIAAALDLFFPGTRPGHRFYFVLRVGERFDRWLSLFGAAQKADALEDGLFGASRAGSASLLGRLEQIVLGEAEPQPAWRKDTAAGSASEPSARHPGERGRRDPCLERPQRTQRPGSWSDVVNRAGNQVVIAEAGEVIGQEAVEPGGQAMQEGRDFVEEPVGRLAWREHRLHGG